LHVWSFFFLFVQPLLPERLGYLRRHLELLHEHSKVLLRRLEQVLQ
jgi:hypothetical protein